MPFHISGNPNKCLCNAARQRSNRSPAEPATGIFPYTRIFCSYPGDDIRNHRSAPTHRHCPTFPAG